jgi:hypothetical protein
MKIKPSRVKELIKEEIQKLLKEKVDKVEFNKVRRAINQAAKAGDIKTPIWKKLRRLNYKSPAEAMSRLKAALGKESATDKVFGKGNFEKAMSAIKNIKRRTPAEKKALADAEKMRAAVSKGVSRVTKAADTALAPSKDKKQVAKKPAPEEKKPAPEEKKPEPKKYGPENIFGKGWQKKFSQRMGKLRRDVARSKKGKGKPGRATQRENIQKEIEALVYEVIKEDL